MRTRSNKTIATILTAVFSGGLDVCGVADIHDVPLDGDIQAAIDSADAGDIVRLAAGTYHSPSITLKSEVAVEGVDPEIEGAQTTVIFDGQSRGFSCSPDSEVALRRLRIECPMGTAVDSSGNTDASGVIEDCIFQNCKAALILFDGNWEIQRCRFAECGPGGSLGGAACGAVGLHLGLPSGTQFVRFADCIFEDNASHSVGGAIYAYYGALDIDNCIFRRNRATSGGAIMLSQNYQHLSIRNSRFEHNVTTGSAAQSSAIFGGNSTHLALSNCDFRSNYSAGLRADILGNIHPENCTFNTCCTVDPTAAAGHGNIWLHASGEQDHGMCLTCRCDFTCNGSVGSEDLGALLGNWGSNDPRFDVNHDMVVSAIDLAQVLVDWGTCR